MAVVHYTDSLGNEYGPRNFPPPKRADLKHWWKAAQKVLPDMPPWPQGRVEGSVERESIIFKGSFGIVMISRQKYMR